MDGDKFWKMSECYIRGCIIKYFRVPDDVIDKVKEDVQLAKMRNRSIGSDGSGRGGHNRNTRGRGGPGQAGSNRGRGNWPRGGGWNRGRG